MNYNYPARFKQKENNVLVFFVDFACCVDGRTVSEAMTTAREAAGGLFYLMLSKGEPLPVPSDPLTLKPESENEFISLVTINQKDIYLDNETELVKKTLTIPSWLNQSAMKKNINFSKVLREALLQELANEKSA